MNTFSKALLCALVALSTMALTTPSSTTLDDVLQALRTEVGLGPGGAAHFQSVYQMSYHTSIEAGPTGQGATVIHSICDASKMNDYVNQVGAHTSNHDVAGIVATTEDDLPTAAGCALVANRAKNDVGFRYDLIITAALELNEAQAKSHLRAVYSKDQVHAIALRAATNFQYLAAGTDNIAATAQSQLQTLASSGL